MGAYLNTSVAAMELRTAEARSHAEHATSAARALSALSLKTRLLLCERVVEQESTLTKAAAAAEVSVHTARKLARR